MRHAVYLEELLDYLCAECVASPTGREGKFVAFGVRIGPDKVGHGAFMGDFAEAIDDFDLVDGVD